MSESYTFLSRVPNYEPPAGEALGAAGPAVLSGTRRAPGRGRHSSPARSSAHSGTSPRSSPDVTRPRAAADAQRFTEHAFRLVLEVLDRRRNVRQLRPVVVPSLLDVARTLALAESPSRRLGVATLLRVHLRVLDDNTLEAFGTYGRGPRVFVIAARVERKSDTGWIVTSMVVG